MHDTYQIDMLVYMHVLLLNSYVYTYSTYYSKIFHCFMLFKFVHLLVCCLVLFEFFFGGGDSKKWCQLFCPKCLNFLWNVYHMRFLISLMKLTAVKITTCLVYNCYTQKASVICSIQKCEPNTSLLYKCKIAFDSHFKPLESLF